MVGRRQYGDAREEELRYWGTQHSTALLCSVFIVKTTPFPPYVRNEEWGANRARVYQSYSGLYGTDWLSINTLAATFSHEPLITIMTFKTLNASGGEGGGGGLYCNWQGFVVRPTSFLPLVLSYLASTLFMKIFFISNQSLSSNWRPEASLSEEKLPPVSLGLHTVVETLAPPHPNIPKLTMNGEMLWESEMTFLRQFISFFAATLTLSKKFTTLKTWSVHERYNSFPPLLFYWKFWFNF